MWSCWGYTACSQGTRNPLSPSNTQYLPLVGRYTEAEKISPPLPSFLWILLPVLFLLLISLPSPFFFLNISLSISCPQEAPATPITKVWALGETSLYFFLQLARACSQIPWGGGHRDAAMGPLEGVLFLYLKHPKKRLLLTGLWGALKTMGVRAYFSFSVSKVASLQILSF